MQPVALVHDYLTQRGGAERVALALAQAFPKAPLHTSLYSPDETYPGFRSIQVCALPINRLSPLRHHHRLALPLLAPSFSRLHVSAEVTVCSSSGWAHGARTSGRKVVYCHTPARWLYQSDRYLEGSSSFAKSSLRLLRPSLKRWDKRAAATAHRYLVNSTAVKARVRDLYGIDAEVLAPPPGFDADGPRSPVQGIEPGFLLCVSRLVSYKNVEAVVAAFAALPKARLVVAGGGPLWERIRDTATPNVSLLGEVADDELRWLYAGCAGLIAASYEDFGLTPVEAASFGKPSAVLRWGGFVDTTKEGVTGVFFDRPEPRLIADGVESLLESGWDATALSDHARTFSLDRFIRSIQGIVAEEALAGS